MKLNTQEQINKVWNAYFGVRTTVNDPFDRRIDKNQHGTNSPYSWEVDHIWPKHSDNSLEGANVWENVQPLASLSNREKTNKLQGRSNGITFAIHKVNTYEGKKIGRMSIKKGDTWYWGYNEPRY